MAQVTIDKVAKIYPGGIKAVRNISLTVKDNEFLVLVGPSGCGKSTTLRMVAGLEEISEGQVKIGERVVNDIPPKDRDIAMVFQNYALYAHMSVYDNLAFGLKLRKLPKAEIAKRVQAAAEILGIEDYLERLPKNLSGGQRQRVAMGRAIVRNPAVFLFDEPLSNLDAKMRVEMRKEILQLHRKVKNTMMYVTHDQIEAMTLGDRICVMRDGVIEQIAEPITVYHYPASLFVARFIGTPPMNILEGTLKKNGDHFTFDGGDISAQLPSSMNEAIKQKEGKKVYFGIRPRAFERAELADDTNKATIWKATIDVIETLGDELLAHVICGNHRFQVSLDAHQSKEKLEGDIELCPILPRAHVFDGKTEENLTMPKELFESAGRSGGDFNNK